MVQNHNNLQPHVSDGKNNLPQLTSLELFAGAGGMALGAHLAGFQHIGLIEWDRFAVDTLRENSLRMLDLDPDCVAYKDAREVDFSPLRGKVDLLAGGPPCQPFSTGGNNGGWNDRRNMFPVALDAVGAILPRAVMFENVKGLCRRKFSKYVDYIERRLRCPLHQPFDGESWEDHYLRLKGVEVGDYHEDESYFVTHQLIDTADYGVPQRRERVLFIALRRDLGIQDFYLPPTHSKEALFRDQWVTGSYWDRHHVQPFDYLGTNGKKLVATLQGSLYTGEGKLPWVTVRDILSDLPQPVMRGEVELIRNHVQVPGARIYPGHIGSFYDYPSKALKAGTHGTPGGENMLRVPPNNTVRYFTTREAARLQTFPDDWHFHGTWGACIKQLGNAVPVEVIRIFSAKIHELLTDHDQTVKE